MKLQKTYNTTIWSLNRDQIDINLEEYSTVWKISGHKLGNALPFALGWTYSKKTHKTKESAIQAFLKEVTKTYPKYNFQNI